MSAVLMSDACYSFWVKKLDHLLFSFLTLQLIQSVILAFVSGFTIIQGAKIRFYPLNPHHPRPIAFDLILKSILHPVEYYTGHTTFSLS